MKHRTGYKAKWKSSKTKKWYNAIRRAARARRGVPNAFSPKRSSYMKKKWEDKKYKAKQLKVLHKAAKHSWRKKDRRTKHAKMLSPVMKKFWKDNYEEMVQKRRDQVTPKVLKNLSKRMKATWADPIYYAKMCKTRKTQSKGNQARSPKGSWYRTKYKGNKGSFWMRSGWEVAFANWLDHYGISWEYETKRFWLRKGRYYTPDFYLPDQDEYVELKGWLSKKDERKMLRFNKLYPDFTLHVFFAKHMYNVLKFKVKK